MNKFEQYEETIENIRQCGEQNALLRLKVETLHFDFLFEMDEDSNLQLVQTKAVIRVLGKVTKVTLKDGDTWEAAYERVRQHWSEYFKEYRSGTKPTDASKANDRVRAKRYRSNKRAEEQEFLKRG